MSKYDTVEEDYAICGDYYVRCASSIFDNMLKQGRRLKQIDRECNNLMRKMRKDDRIRTVFAYIKTLDDQKENK